MSRKSATTTKSQSKSQGPSVSTGADRLIKPPVVSVLGHVDHGKTSLLDAIRKTNLQSKEAGGITQSIGAYQVTYNGQPITFIDTPGHEAFTAMRARGGSVADIVILVIAANEGVKPQTVESIGHARAAGVPMIIALTKSDLDSANPERVKQELLEHDVITEEHGGDVVTVSVSAKTGEGIDSLLEMLVLVSEMRMHEQQGDSSPRGIIIESEKNARTGVVATGIVQEGSVRRGDILATVTTWGKIKRMTDWRGTVLEEATAGTPVALLGFAEPPAAGETFVRVESEKEALAQQNDEKVSEEEAAADVEKIVQLIIKADTHGALEAFKASLEALSDDEARVDIVSAGLSAINEADIMLASVSNAIILGFNVVIDPAASRAAQLEHVPVMTYDVIYRAIEDVGELLDSEVEKIRAVGEAEVLQVFQLSNGTYVAGSKILEGHIAKGAKIQVIREEEVVFEARVTSLRHGKEERSKMEEGSECGVILSKSFEFIPGDILLAFAQ